MKPDKTSDRITRRALDILKKQGPPAVSMRRIAWAVSSITPMAIYHHFRNRDALSNSITDREFRKLLGHIQVRLRFGLTSTVTTCCIAGGRIGLSEKEFRQLLHRSPRRFLHGLKP